MKSLNLLRILTLVCSVFNSCTSKKEIVTNQVSMQWRYDVPATKYWEGLSIGTGRFSAMIPGALGHEVIAFDETLWTSDPYNPNNPEEQEVFKKVRDLINRWKSVIDENLIEFNAKAGEKYVIK